VKADPLEVLLVARLRAVEHTNEEPKRFEVTPAFAVDFAREMAATCPDHFASPAVILRSIACGSAMAYGIPISLRETRDKRSLAFCIWSRP
jgi:hypothetical protein